MAPAASVAREGDPLGVFRERVAYGLAIGGSLTLLPFAANNFVQGRVLLGFATGAVIAVLIANALAIYFGRATTALRIVIFLPAIAGLALSVRAQGVPGVMWSYPALLMFHVMFARRTANVINGVLLTLIVLLAAESLGVPLAIRSAVTMGLLVMCANIFSAVMERLQRQLLDEAVIDPLTGAFNRRRLDAELGAAAEERTRYGVPVSLLALDIDHFKRVNDELGHARGDAVLRGIGAAIRARLRLLDSVFRIGGEEFLILLPHTTCDDAARVAEAMRAAVEHAPLLPDRRVTVSIGVAEMTSLEDVEEWAGRCDGALYRAKAEGRNRVVVHDLSNAII